jgi:hypothetical protein
MRISIIYRFFYSVRMKILGEIMESSLAIYNVEICSKVKPQSQRMTDPIFRQLAPQSAEGIQVLADKEPLGSTSQSASQRSMYNP